VGDCASQRSSLEALIGALLRILSSTRDVGLTSTLSHDVAAYWLATPFVRDRLCSTAPEVFRHAPAHSAETEEAVLVLGPPSAVHFELAPSSAGFVRNRLRCRASPRLLLPFSDVHQRARLS
jgi:hypothetical protein